MKTVSYSRFIYNHIRLNAGLYLTFLFYISLFFFAYWSFYLFNLFAEHPTKENLCNWDAYWYHKIKTGGYQFSWDEPSSSAFFPLFPYVWRLLHLNPFGICVFNFAIYLAGLIILFRHLKLSVSHIFLFMSVPSSMFFFLPYTESLFFLFCAIFLAGLRTGNNKLVITGLFLSSLTRATAMFFIPAIIIMELMNEPAFFSKASLKNTGLYIITAASALFIVVLVQYYQTHEWFAFVKQQVKFWGHKFSWPGFPLISYSVGSTLWIDGVAFITGLTAMCIVTVFFLKKLRCIAVPLFANRTYWFSACYIVAVTIYSLFFNNKAGAGQTSLDSLNRYIFSTAFFCVFLWESFNYFSFSLKNISILVVITAAGFLMLGLCGPPLAFIDKARFGKYGTLLFFFALLNYILYYYLTTLKPYGKYVLFVLAGFNIFLTAYLLNLFLSGTWVA